MPPSTASVEGAVMPPPASRRWGTAEGGSSAPTDPVSVGQGIGSYLRRPSPPSPLSRRPPSGGRRERGIWVWPRPVACNPPPHRGKLTGSQNRPRQPMPCWDWLDSRSKGDRADPTDRTDRADLWQSCPAAIGRRGCLSVHGRRPGPEMGPCSVVRAMLEGRRRQPLIKAHEAAPPGWEKPGKDSRERRALKNG